MIFTFLLSDLNEMHLIIIQKTKYRGAEDWRNRPDRPGGNLTNPEPIY